MTRSQVVSYIKMLASRKHSHTKPFVKKNYTKKCSPHPTPQSINHFLQSSEYPALYTPQLYIDLQALTSLFFKLLFQHLLQEIQLSSEVCQNSPHNERNAFHIYLFE